jgi:elongation factor P
MTIGFSELRRGVAIEVDGHPYEVVEYTRVKMQQRAPVVRVKLRSILDGKVVERAFQQYTNEFKLADVEYIPAQYLYTDGQFYHFMNTQTYEQYELSKQQMGDNIYYIKDGMELEMLFYNGKANSVRLPLSVQLKVIETPPGFKGDTATGGNKPATLETGLTVQVPLFVNSGDIIKVDTRTGDYQERVA